MKLSERLKRLKTNLLNTPIVMLGMGDIIDKAIELEESQQTQCPLINNNECSQVSKSAQSVKIADLEQRNKELQECNDRHSNMIVGLKEQAKTLMMSQCDGSRIAKLEATIRDLKKANGCLLEDRTKLAQAKEYMAQRNQTLTDENDKLTQSVNDDWCPMVNSNCMCTMVDGLERNVERLRKENDCMKQAHGFCCSMQSGDRVCMAVAKLEDKNKKLQGDIDALEAEKQSLKSENASWEKMHIEQGAKINDYNSMYSENKRLKKQIKSLEKKAKRYKADGIDTEYSVMYLTIKDMQEKNRQLREENNERLWNHTKLEDRLVELAEENTALKNRCSTSGYMFQQDNIEELKQTIASQRAEIGRLKKEIHKKLCSLGIWLNEPHAIRGVEHNYSPRNQLLSVTVLLETE